MNTNNRIQKSQRVLYIGLAITLIACLWIGWSDFDPDMTQEVVRENIRSSIRGLIQISIQYLIPLAILVFFTSELFNRIPLEQDRENAQQNQ